MCVPKQELGDEKGGELGTRFLAGGDARPTFSHRPEAGATKARPTDLVVLVPKLNLGTRTYWRKILLSLPRGRGRPIF